MNNATFAYFARKYFADWKEHGNSFMKTLAAKLQDDFFLSRVLYGRTDNSATDLADAFREICSDDDIKVKCSKDYNIIDIDIDGFNGRLSIKYKHPSASNSNHVYGLAKLSYTLAPSNTVDEKNENILKDICNKNFFDSNDSSTEEVAEDIKKCANILGIQVT